MKLLSVVVPVYNVADYVEECLSSIVSQTYRELEIIVVDDGSTDGSGELCDSYSQKDSRIVVVHQENQGLSVARNTGLKLCHGEYIAFIDSDDTYGTPDVLEQNIRLLDENSHIDFVQFPFINSETKEQQLVFPQVFVHDRAERYKRFFLNEICGSVWNKIYRSGLISGISFIPGKIYEDQFFTSAVVGRSRGFVLSDLGYYYYRIREGSIIRSEMTPQKYRDLFHFSVLHIETSLRETPKLYDFQLALLSLLFYMYLKIPVCRQFYEDNGYDFLKLIPVLVKKTRSKIHLLFKYYLFLSLGLTITLWILKIKNFLRDLPKRIL